MRKVRECGTRMRALHGRAISCLLPRPYLHLYPISNLVNKFKQDEICFLLTGPQARGHCDYQRMIALYQTYTFKFNVLDVIAVVCFCDPVE